MIIYCIIAYVLIFLDICIERRTGKLEDNQKALALLIWAISPIMFPIFCVDYTIKIILVIMGF